MKNSNRGAALVEASLIIPVIITVIITLIYIIMGLYHLVEQNCEFHHSLLMREEDTFSIGDFVRKIDFMKGLLF